jgi:hypothetical protein
LENPFVVSVDNSRHNKWIIFCILQIVSVGLADT